MEILLKMCTFSSSSERGVRLSAGGEGGERGEGGAGAARTAPRHSSLSDDIVLSTLNINNIYL